MWEPVLVTAGGGEADDDVLAALDHLQQVLEESLSRGRVAAERAAEIRRLRSEGLSYGDIVPLEARPLSVEIVTSTLGEIADASSRFRRAQARALYAEGLTMAQIAELFGVSRQRVAALLRPS